MVSQLTLPVFILLQFMVYQVSSQQTCELSELTRCMLVLRTLYEKRGLVFATTEDSVNENCRQYNSAFQCVDNYLNQCLDSTTQDVYRSTISGTKNFLANMCTEGSEFRKEYLTHVDCYQKAEPGYNDCANTSVIQLEKIMKEDLSGKNRVKDTCGVFHELRECSRKAILVECGEKAAEFGEKMFTITGGDTINTHCFSAGISLHSIPLTYVWFCLIFVFTKNGLFFNTLR